MIGRKEIERDFGGSEAFRSKKHRETEGKNALIIIIMTVAFAKMGGNIAMIFEHPGLIFEKLSHS